MNRRNSNWNQTLSISMLLLPLAVSQIGYASYTEVESKAQIETLYDDNISLDNEDKDDAFETTTTLQGRITKETETSTVSGDLKWDYINYQSSDDLDNRNDFTLKFKANRRDERNRWQFDAKGVSDSTAKDVEIGDSEDVAGNVGLVRDDIDRRRFYLTPSWRHDLSETSQIDLRYRYSDLRFSDRGNSGLVDSYNHNVTGTYFLQTSDRNTLIPSASLNHFESEESDKYDIVKADIANERRYDNLFTSFASASVFYADADSGDVDKSEVDFLYEISGRYEAELFQLRATIERILAPGDFGDVITRDQYSMGLEGSITPKWGYSLEGQYYRNRTLIKDIADSRRRYTAILGSAIWSATEAIDVEFGYRFRKEKDTDQNDADSNAVFISVSYNQLFNR